MSGEAHDDKGTPPAVSAPVPIPPAASAPDTPAPIPDPVPAASTPESFKVPEGHHLVPDGSFRRIKDEAMEKGRHLAMSDFDKKAKAAGFKDTDDALAALARLQAGQQGGGDGGHGAAPAVTEPDLGAALATTARDKVKDEFAKERETLRGRAKVEEERRKAAEADAKQAREQATTEIARIRRDSELREKALAAGVKPADVRFALQILDEAVQATPEVERAKFDADKFFAEKLKADRPYFYTGAARPANTDPGAAPGAPDPEKARANGQEPAFDARTASTADVAQRLRSMGLGDLGIY